MNGILSALSLAAIWLGVPSTMPATAPATEAVDGGDACPGSAPVEGDVCASSGRRCVYAERPECGSVFDCHLGRWVMVAGVVPCTQRRGVCGPRGGGKPVDRKDPM